MLKFSSIPRLGSWICHQPLLLFSLSFLSHLCQPSASLPVPPCVLHELCGRVSHVFCCLRQTKLPSNADTQVLILHSHLSTLTLRWSSGCAGLSCFSLACRLPLLAFSGTALPRLCPWLFVSLSSCLSPGTCMLRYSMFQSHLCELPCHAHLTL